MTHAVYMDETSGRWTQWIVDRQYDGDPYERERVRRNLEVVRDRVFDAARLRPHGVVPDLGCGAGLLGLEALGRALFGRAILVDISAKMLSLARTRAEKLGILPRCSFFLAPVEAFAEVVHERADVVVARAVLIQVHNKAAVFRQIYSAMRDRGRR